GAPRTNDQADAGRVEGVSSGNESISPPSHPPTCIHQHAKPILSRRVECELVKIIGAGLLGITKRADIHARIGPTVNNRRADRCELRRTQVALAQSSSPRNV